MNRRNGSSIRPGFGGEQQIGSFRRIDDRTGFMVWNTDTKFEWDGLIVVDPDKRNPQDFVTGVPDPQVVPNPRPPPANYFLPATIFTETNIPLFTQSNEVLQTEGGAA